MVENPTTYTPGQVDQMRLPIGGGRDEPAWVARLRAEGHVVHSPVHGPRPHPLIQFPRSTPPHRLAWLLGFVRGLIDRGAA
jgi:hypothetical protein